MDESKKEKLRLIIKLVLMFLALILIFAIIGAINKKKPQEEIAPKYKEETEIKNKEEEQDTKSLYPKLKDTSIKEITVNSPELEAMIKDTLHIASIGKVEAEFDGYKNIFSKGIEVKESFGKALALKFNSKYENSIIGGIGVGNTADKIIEKLGTPNLNHNNTLLYILDGADVVFNLKYNEVVAYKNKNQDKERYSEIINLYEEYIKDKDLKKFISTVTKNNPVYYRYDYDENNVLLDYFDLGIRLKFNKEGKTNGLYLFDNFLKSENYDQEKVDKLKKEKLVYLEELRLSVTEDLYKEEERDIREKQEEKIAEDLNLDINGQKIAKIPKDVGIYYEEELNGDYRYKNIIIRSKTNSFPTHYLNSAGLANEILIWEDRIIYAIDNDGIYRKMINETESQKIYAPEQKEKIVFEAFDEETNEIYFNEKKIKIK